MTRVSLAAGFLSVLACCSFCLSQQAPSLEIRPATTLPSPASRTSASSAERPAVAHDFRRDFQVVRAEKAPVIDGKIDDECWAKAVPLKDFYVSQMFSDDPLPERAKDQTEARVLFDDNGLYVGIKAFQDPKTIYSKIRENGYLRPDLDWQSGSEEWCNSGCDEIEVAIDPELTLCSHYIFHVNPNGAMQKHFMPPAQTGAGLYKRIDPVETKDDRWKAAAQRTDDGWTAEIFIPYESIHFQTIKPYKSNDVFVDMVQEQLTVMGFNIHRISHQRREASSWSPSKGSHFFRDVEHFGVASFRPRPCWLEATATDHNCQTDIAYKIHSRSDQPQKLSLQCLMQDGKGQLLARSMVAEVSVEAGGVAANSFAVSSMSPGQHGLDLRLLDEKGDLLDRIKLRIERPEPLSLLLPVSVLYADEPEFSAELGVNQFNLSEKPDRIVFRLNQAGKPVQEIALSLPETGRVLLPCKINAQPGRYELAVQALASDKPLYTSTRQFDLLASPYEANVSGKAGEGEVDASKTPEAFTLLASGPEGSPQTQPTTAPAGKPLPGDMKKAPLLIWPVTATEDFERQLQLQPEQLSLPIRAFAAGDEYEPICFALRANQTLKNLRIDPGELKLEGENAKAALPVSQLDLRVEDASTYLVKQETLGDMPPDSLRKYWLTAYVAPGTPAGLYKGTLKISADGVAPIERPYSLLVLPFALEPSPLHEGIYGRWSASKQTNVEVRDAITHGLEGLHAGAVLSSSISGGVNIHHLIWDMYIDSEEGWLGPSPERFNSIRINEGALKAIKQAGMKPPIIIDVNYALRGLPCTEENAELFGELIQKIEAKRKEIGLEEFVYHLVDEPYDHYGYDDGRFGRRYGIERVAFFGQVVKNLGLKVFETINSGGRGGDVGESARDQIDIWCTNDFYRPEQIDRWTTDGKELWLYNFAGDGVCKGQRSTFGFYAFKVRASGVTQWVYEEMHQWNAKEQKTLPMARWEAIREGVDDARYVATLHKALARAYTDGDEKARLADQAQTELDAIIQAFPAMNWEKTAFEERNTAEMWNRWRWILADWIVRMQ